MLFNSIDFFLFFAVVTTQYFRAPFLIRWSLALAGVAFPVFQYGRSPNPIAASVFSALGLIITAVARRRHGELLARKILLAIASLLFYSAWRWPFTSLLLGNTLFNYVCVRAVEGTADPRRRRLFLILALVGNLGVLGIFKYTNFILENLEGLLGLSGLTVDLAGVSILLPLGISFYTFHTMSYVIEVYRGHMRARKSLLDIILFASFFPQLVAGPILRANQFIPQLDECKTWDPRRVKSGLLLMIWGMAKKLLIADALAPIVNQAYAHPDLYSGPALVLATYCFAFQIYGDFSGYTDLAIGASRVLGFDIPINFNRPYFATNISTFWKRWHISLSTWLRDYLYISLGGSRCSRSRTLFNLMATMFLGGLWHGATWNFVIWGTIHGVMLVLHRVFLMATGRGKARDETRPIPWLVLATLNFHLVCLTWVFFRAETLAKAVAVLGRIVQGAPGLMVPWLFPAVLIPALLAIQAVQARTTISTFLLRSPRLSRLLIYAGIALMAVVISSTQPVDFIYFVF